MKNFLYTVLVLLLLWNCKQELNPVGNDIFHDKGDDFKDASSEFYDPEFMSTYSEYLNRYLKNRGYSQGLKYAAVTVHLYVVRAGTRAVTKAELENSLLEEMYKGWSFISVNPILLQIGVWVKNVVICEIYDHVDDQGGGYYRMGDGNEDNWIYDSGPRTLKAAPSATTAYGCSYPAGKVVSSRDEYRILWSKGDSGKGYSVARYGYLVVRMRYDHGRNLIAHEMGHNFGLPHVNSSYEFPCAFAKDPDRTMYTPILPTGFSFDPCETAVARANLECYIDHSTKDCFHYTNAIAWEEPSYTYSGKSLSKDDLLARSRSFVNEEFLPTGCAQSYLIDPRTRYPIVPPYTQDLISLYPSATMSNRLGTKSYQNTNYTTYYPVTGANSGIPIWYCDSFLMSDPGLIRTDYVPYRSNSEASRNHLNRHVTGTWRQFCDSKAYSRCDTSHCDFNSGTYACFFIRKYGSGDQTANQEDCTFRMLNLINEAQGWLAVRASTNCKANAP